MMIIAILEGSRFCIQRHLQRIIGYPSPSEVTLATSRPSQLPTRHLPLHESRPLSSMASMQAAPSAAAGKLALRNRLDKSRSPYVSFSLLPHLLPGLGVPLVKNEVDPALLIRCVQVRAHMNNPVAWQVWDSETLALAKKHNRLLFVSIGYAACHCKPQLNKPIDLPEIADLARVPCDGT